MKVFLILVLCLASSQGLFLRHFQNKWDTISGWWAGGQEEPQPQLTETLGETEDSEIILPERQYKDDTSYYYETTSSTISTSTSTTTTAAETTTVSTTSSPTNPTESSTVKGRSRNPRCRTVDSRTPRDSCKDLETCDDFTGACKTVSVCERFYVSVRTVACD